MANKTAVVTGVTNGIGRPVALGLARLGYDLLVVARNPEKGAKLLLDIRSANAQVTATLIEADLKLVADANKVVAAVKERGLAVDVLYQSAGIIPAQRNLTPEGVEESFAISFLTRWVLIHGLLPQVLRSTGKLVVSFASPLPGGNHPIQFDDLNRSRVKFTSYGTVRQFQEANDVLAVELQQTYAKNGLRSFCINPGVVNTGIHVGWPFLIRILLTKIMAPLVMVEPEHSAQLALDIVTGVSREGGPLISNKGLTLAPQPRLLEPEYRKRLFEACRPYVAPETARDARPLLGSARSEARPG